MVSWLTCSFISINGTLPIISVVRNFCGSYSFLSSLFSSSLPRLFLLGSFFSVLSFLLVFLFVVALASSAFALCLLYSKRMTGPPVVTEGVLSTHIILEAFQRSSYAYHRTMWKQDLKQRRFRDASRKGCAQNLGFSNWWESSGCHWWLLDEALLASERALSDGFIMSLPGYGQPYVYFIKEVGYKRRLDGLF